MPPQRVSEDGRLSSGQEMSASRKARGPPRPRSARGFAGQPPPAGPRTARVLDGYRRTVADLGLFAGGGEILR